MRWTDRQQAMLTAMGLGGWWLDAARLAEAHADASAGDGAAVATAPPAPPKDAAQTRSGTSPVSIASPVPSTSSAAAAAPQPASRRAPVASRAVAASANHAGDLASARPHRVRGAGHPQAHWLLVGEASSEQDCDAGQPFGAAASQLLDHILAALGLTRSAAEAARQVYVASIVKRATSPQRSGESIGLAQQIAQTQPRVIVAMGHLAVQQVLHSDEPMGRLRGRVHQAGGVPVVVTYPPAYLLRQPLDKAKAWDDWCLAGSVIDAHG